MDNADRPSSSMNSSKNLKKHIKTAIKFFTAACMGTCSCLVGLTYCKTTISETVPASTLLDLGNDEDSEFTLLKNGQEIQNLETSKGVAIPLERIQPIDAYLIEDKDSNFRIVNGAELKASKTKEFHRLYEGYDSDNKKIIFDKESFESAASDDLTDSLTITTGEIRGYVTPVENKIIEQYTDDESDIDEKPVMNIDEAKKAENTGSYEPAASSQIIITSYSIKNNTVISDNTEISENKQNGSADVSSDDTDDNNANEPDYEISEDNSSNQDTNENNINESHSTDNSINDLQDKNQTNSQNHTEYNNEERINGQNPSVPAFNDNKNSNYGTSIQKIERSPNTDEYLKQYPFSVKK